MKDLHKIEVLQDEDNSVNFRKMKVEGGYFYNFWLNDPQEYSPKWVFTPDLEIENRGLAKRNMLLKKASTVALRKCKVVINKPLPLEDGDLRPKFAEVIIDAYFHRWSDEFEEFDGHTDTMGIIEELDGSIQSVIPSSIKFITED